MRIKAAHIKLLFQNKGNCISMIGKRNSLSIFKKLTRGKLMFLVFPAGAGLSACRDLLIV